MGGQSSLCVFPYLNGGYGGAVSQEGTRSPESCSGRSGSLGLCEEGRPRGEATGCPTCSGTCRGSAVLAPPPGLRAHLRGAAPCSLLAACSWRGSCRCPRGLRAGPREPLPCPVARASPPAQMAEERLRVPSSFVCPPPRAAVPLHPPGSAGRHHKQRHLQLPVRAARLPLRHLGRHDLCRHYPRWQGRLLRECPFPAQPGAPGAWQATAPAPAWRVTCIPAPHLVLVPPPRVETVAPLCRRRN